MEIRALEPKDYAGLLRLLKLQDEHPEYRTMSPESRSKEGLGLELNSPTVTIYAWVLDIEGRMAAYLGLCNFEGETFLEGPLIDPGLDAASVQPLLKHIVSEAKKHEFHFLEAFIDEQNIRAQAALEQVGFEPFRTTFIYELKRENAPTVFRPATVQFSQAHDADLERYRELYKNISENWSSRLAWSDEQLLERFHDPEVEIVFAKNEGEYIGYLELEFVTEDGYAEIAYFGLLPEARGKQIGHQLIARAIQDAFAEPDIALIVARAQDDKRSASHTLEKLGFRLSHGVVAFTLELS